MEILAQQTLDVMQSDPEILDECAFNLYCSHYDVAPQEAWPIWTNLSTTNRQPWHIAAIQHQQNYIKADPYEIEYWSALEVARAELACERYLDAQSSEWLTS